MKNLRGANFQEEIQTDKKINDQFYSSSNDYQFSSPESNYNFYYFMEHCFIIPADSCPIDVGQIEVFYRQINNDRRVNNFETFVKSTDEKQQTTDISSVFLENYIYKFSGFLQSISVVDIGVGQGTLSSMIASNLKGQCNELIYEGIDREETFISKTRKIFLTLEIKNSKFIVGDCFGGDVDQLIDHPTVLFASQVVFYAPNVTNFVDLVVRKMGAVAFVVGQADSSFLNKMNKQYAPSYKQKDVEEKVKSSLGNHSEQVIFSNILYSSYISFPKVDNLTKIATACYNCLTDPDEKKARELMESMSGTPLEYIQYKDNLDKYILDLQLHLKKMDGQAIFWNFMQVIVPKDISSDNKLKDAVKVIYSKKFSGSLIEINKAIIEGNADVIRAILKSGIVVPEIAETKTISAFDKFMTIINCHSLLPLFRNGYKEAVKDRKKLIEQSIENMDSSISEILWDNIDENANKYNVEAIYNEMSRLTASISQEKLKSTSAILFVIRSIFDFSHLISIKNSADNFFQHLDILKYGTWILANIGMNIYEIYMHSNTDFVLAHSLAAEGKNKIFLKFFPFMEDTLNIQSNTGKTALHYALEFNHLDIAYLIISSNKTRLDIRDNRGYLPIHYAAAIGNTELVKYFFDQKNIDINELTHSFKLSLAYAHKVKCLFAFTISSLISYFGDYRKENGKVIYHILEIIRENIIYGFLTKEILLWRISVPEVSLLPTYAKEELMVTLFSYNILKKDSLLHISIKNNHTETSLFLIERGIKLLPNANGIMPIHLAAAINNLQVLEAILQKDQSQISNIAHLDSSDLSFISNIAITITVFAFPILAVNQVISLHGAFNYRVYFISSPIALLWGIYWSFQKTSYLYGNDYGNSLHFAASGKLDITEIAQNYFNQTCRNSRVLTKDQDEQKHSILKFLVEKGADTDYSLQFGLPFLNPILFGVMLADLVLPHSYRIQYVLTTYIITLTKLFYYENLRAIDLVEKHVYDPITNTSSISESYKFLKQHTSVDLVREMSYLEYILYCLWLRSNNDQISIKEYGTYSGGSGKDTFIITKNFEGKDIGLKIIIKDYQAGEEILLDKSFGILNVSTIKYIRHQVLNNNAITLYTRDDQEIVTLLNFDGDIKVKSVYSKQYIYTESLWKYLFQKHKKKILGGIDEVHQSDDDTTIYILSNSVTLPNKIINFDCSNKNQKLDFRAFNNIKTIFDLDLIENIDNKTVTVSDRNSGVSYIELYGVRLEQLSPECFIIGNIVYNFHSEL